MRSIRTSLGAVLVAAALASLAMVPAMAMADTGVPDTTGTVVATPAPPATVAHPARKAVLSYRANAKKRLLALQKDITAVRKRVNRLSVIASLAANAGADVTSVRSELLAARSDLALATQQGKAAAADLRAVPYFVNRAAARAKADAEFKSARSTLRAARVHKRTAAVVLRALVAEYGMKLRVAKQDLAL